MRPIEQDDDDGWVDAHDSEDPYIDYIRVDSPATAAMSFTAPPAFDGHLL